MKQIGGQKNTQWQSQNEQKPKDERRITIIITFNVCSEWDGFGYL